MLTSSTVVRIARSLALGLSITSSAAAQNADSTRGRAFEIRVPTGSLVATGTHGNQLKDARVTALQVSWLVQRHVALTGTFAWARSRDLATAGNPKLDVFTSDVGIEARSSEWAAGRRVSFSTFAGIGAGARTYDYVKLDAGARNNLAGYAAAGGELGVGRVALRVEARNYTTGFKPLAGAGKSDTRNDVIVMAAVRLNRRSSGSR